MRPTDLQITSHAAAHPHPRGGALWLFRLDLDIGDRTRVREDRLQHDQLNKLVEWYAHPATKRAEHYDYKPKEKY